MSEAAEKAARLAATAAQHHRAGRSEQAARLYRAALGLAPGHGETLHGMGRLAHEAGRPDLAVGLLGQAVAASPDDATYTLSLGLALLECGHAEPARAALHVAVLRDGSDPRAHRALGQALLRLGRLGEAEASLEQAVRLDPTSAAARLSLGGVLRARGAARQAVESFEEAARLLPGDPLVWHALASCHAARGALEQAEAGFRRAAALLPGDAAAQANLGTALWGQNRLEEARETLLRALEMAPSNPETLSSLGLVLMGLGESAEAERRFAQAHELAPEADAIAINHGTALAALGRRAAAETSFRSVLEREAGHAAARFNLATVLLARGARREGWEAFEARRGLAVAAEASLPSNPPNGALPEWDGAPGAGTVLIEAEQGLGDAIQFLRWVASAARRAPLRLALPPLLLGLVRTTQLFDPARVRTVSSAEPITDHCTWRASLLSLPHLLDEPDPPPMTLRPDPAAVEGWRAHLARTCPRGSRVGLAWAGSRFYRFDRSRSIRPDQLAPLGAVSGVTLVSLQHNGEAMAPASGLRLVMPEGAFADLADTAALIDCLDLVISVDTAVAHLAGALGKPVWLLDRFGGDWRWQEGFAHGRDWYPGLRRFAQRQPALPDAAWDETIREVATALGRWAQPE